MNALTPKQQANIVNGTDLYSRLNELPLESLFEEAITYGRIHLFQAGDSTFSFTIEFETVPGVKLEAKSGFNHKTIKSAVIKAIDQAKTIRAQFK